MIQHPRLTVIIPIYNIEKYLEASIESVLNQTIGFEDNCELLLVDDGSTDLSSDICKQYTERYPNNIKYIYQDNSGVSSARNNGLSQAHGKYIHFFDGDDILSRDFYAKATVFLDDHQSVDLVAIKIKFFDAIIDSHPLNKKFHKERVVLLDKEPDNPLLHLTTCVFRGKVVEGSRFDEQLQITEDTLFLNAILFEKKAYGVLSKPTYYYRKRSNDSSAINGKYANKSFYTDTLTRAYSPMIKTWTTGGQLHPYMQHLILYDLLYRFQQASQSVLTSSEENVYKKSINAIVKLCNDDVIINHDSYDMHLKLYLLKLKHANKYKNHLSLKKDGYYFDKEPLSIKWKPSVFIDFIHENSKESITLEGYVDNIIELSDVNIVVDGTSFSLVGVSRKQREVTFLGDTIFDGMAFQVTLPIRVGNSIEFEVRSGLVVLPIRTGAFTRLGAIKGSYRSSNNYIIRKLSRKLRFHYPSRLRHIWYELTFLLALCVYWKLARAGEQYVKLRTRNLSQLSTKAKLFEIAKPFFIVAETIVMIPRALVMRVGYHALSRSKKRPIWVVSDRGMAAGDNGEALFRYIMACNDVPAEVYFAISKKSKDYQRIKSLGRVLNQGSLRHKMYFLLADKIISSHADIEVTNPFLRQVDQVVDLYTFDFVFLQHGVTKDDISSWLNRFEKNIRLFITAGKPEYNSILEYPYYYTESEVTLSGFPRYDLLENKPKNKIIIAPTYRAQLLKSNTDATGTRSYDDTFKQSYYFRFYNDLINDTRILAALRDNNMTAEFYPHPNFVAQQDDFKLNHLVKMARYPYDYKKAFSEGNLLVTDYSSVAFDFAYLRKPVIYTQFDRIGFFSGHSYTEGYFNYENDGFGPVCGNYASTIDKIVESINKGTVLNNIYRERIDEFFAHDDTKSSQRVYEKILTLRPINNRDKV